MTRKRKSWREKLHDSKDLPKVVEIPEKMKARVGEGTMVVPAPIEVDDITQISCEKARCHHWLSANNRDIH